jgi:hypothetical protein
VGRPSKDEPTETGIVPSQINGDGISWWIKIERKLRPRPKEKRDEPGFAEALSKTEKSAFSYSPKPVSGAM